MFKYKKIPNITNHTHDGLTETSWSAHWKKEHCLFLSAPQQ